MKCTLGLVAGKTWSKMLKGISIARAGILLILAVTLYCVFPLVHVFTRKPIVITTGQLLLRMETVKVE